MSKPQKKRKLSHGGGGGAAARNAAAAAPALDDRFAMDSDFDDGDAGPDAELQQQLKLRRASGARAGPQTPAAGKPGKQKKAATAPPPQRRRQPEAQAPPSDDEGAGTEPGQGEEGNGAGRDAAAGSGGGGGGEDSDAERAADAAGTSEGAVDGGDGSSDDGDGGSGDGDGGSGSGDGEGGSEDPDHDAAAGGGEGGRGPTVKKVLSKRKLQRVKEASDRRGIVYVSRIPPHMKPHKLRQLLEPFGALGRVYCAPEDPALRRMRKKKGGNSGKNFTEGWVEFEDKRRAKRAAVALNGQPMGGSKRSAYHYDLWAIKYLPRFKWDTLTEEINYQRAVREQKLVAEISAAKRERDFYLSRVDKAKALDAMQERRAKKQHQQQQGAAAGGEQQQQQQQQQQQAQQQAAAAAAPKAPAAAAAVAAAGGHDAGGGGGGGEGGRRARHFGQRRAKADPVLDSEAPVLAADVLGLLGRRQG